MFQENHKSPWIPVIKKLDKESKERMVSFVLVFHQLCIVSPDTVPRIWKKDVGCRENHSVYSLWNISFSKTFCNFPFRQTKPQVRKEHNHLQCHCLKTKEIKTHSLSPVWSNYVYFIMAGCNCSSHDYVPLSSSLCKEYFAVINVCFWLFIGAPVKLFHGMYPDPGHVIAPLYDKLPWRNVLLVRDMCFIT